jgi:tetratricopeptide (TPR) repeat protein
LPLPIEILASLLPQQAVNELARIARFEESARISKQAALAIMKVPYPADSHGRIERAERLERAIGYGDRTAIRWLRLYVAALRGETVGAKTTVELWQTFVENDTKLTREEQSDASSVEIVVDMRHLLGDFHELHGDHALAFEARKQVNQAVFADDDEVIRWLDWLLRRSAWPAVIDLAERNEARFDRKSVLLYGLAEAQLRMGVDPVTRDATCDRANTVMPKNDDTERYFTAAYLQDERGLFDWAEREYRHIIKHGGQDSVNRAFAANRLAEMLYNDGHGKEAYDVMHALMEEMKESEIVRQVVEDRWGSNLAALKSRMNLYLATHHRDQKNHQREREYLKRGLKLDPTEADVLIAMYRVKDADEEWRKKTRRAINNTIESFRRNIYDSRRVSEGAGNNENNGGQSLSGALNQLAWLVANTEGDYAEALRMSKKSLELDPGDAGVMDTLARCYYSVNDYENGVKYQRWAVQRNPHNGLMHKQLDLFEKALATSRSDAPDGADR